MRLLRKESLRNPQSRSATYSETKRKQAESLTMITHKSHQRIIRTLHDILNRRAAHLRDSLLLLDVVQNDRGRAEDEAGRTTVKDLVRLDGRLDGLDD